jgi:coenzyme PQQ synthesis protein D (PqqD)
VQQISSLTLSSVVARRDDVIHAEIDQKIVALNLENSTCYGLDPVGSRIWSLLASPIRIGDICTTLLTEYKVEPSTCERRVVDLLEEIRAEGLIVTPEEQ